MPCDVSHLTNLIELWFRRHAPESADLQRALHIARRCCDDPTSPLWIRSMSWRLVRDAHAAAGWEIPPTENLAPCRAAAASVRHGCSMLINEIADQVDAIDGPVLLLGAFGAGRSVFGRWDVLPTTAAVLIPFTLDTAELPSATSFNLRQGVSWASAGQHRGLLAKHSTEVQLNGRKILVPTPEMVVARTSIGDLEPGSLGSLIFCGAAYKSTAEARWSEAESLARRLEAPTPPLELAMRLGIDRWLGLKVPTRKRMALAIQRVFRRPAA